MNQVADVLSRMLLVSDGPVWRWVALHGRGVSCLPQEYEVDPI